MKSDVGALSYIVAFDLPNTQLIHQHLTPFKALEAAIIHCTMLILIVNYPSLSWMELEVVVSFL